MKKPKFRTPEEKADILNNIKKLQNEGKTLATAMKEYGINPSQYYAWVKKDAKKVAKPKKVSKLQQVISIPLEEPGNVLIVAGKQSEVLSVLERLANLRG